MLEDSWEESELPAAKILVVDDSEPNLIAIAALLSTLGHDVVSARSGMEALELAAGQEYAVILLDIMMPVLDGFGTLARLREIPAAQHTPVVFLTAHGPDATWVERAYLAGAFDYITKPITPAVLRGKVSAFVLSYRRGQEMRRRGEALRVKDRYIGMLAHDLRNPLGIISMGALMLENATEPGVRDVAARMARAASRMDRLTGDLLEFARAAASRMPARPEVMDLSELCRSIVADFQTMYPQIAFALSQPSELPGRWDRERLQQALVNLVVNAVKYGKGQVSIEARVLGGWIEVEVSNAGEDIPPARLEHMFEPFIRGTEREAGVGLGLFIVRQIVQIHGGEVTATSANGVTAFRLRLPADRAQA